MRIPAAALLAIALGHAAIRAEVESEIPIGVEAVMGARSEYVYRGFGLGSPILEFQVEGELALRDDLLLSGGGWIASELGDDFSEGSAFLDLRYDFHERFTAGASLGYHAFDHSFFEDGFDLGTFLTWFVGEEWDVTAGVYRDFGADAWYAHAESGWSYRLSDDAYAGVSGGVSVVDSYYGRSGFNDFYGRVSLTYNVTSTVSLTPFVGWSMELKDADGHELFGGLWFEVSF